MTIGVVIPCRDEAARIAEVLDALATQDCRPDRTVVVDDGSSDGTRATVERWRAAHPELALSVVNGPARGIAAAVNAGIASLDTDIVIRLDGHCRPPVDYVRRTASVLRDPGVGVSGGAWTIVPGADTLQARAIAIAVEHRFGSGGSVYRRAGRGNRPADPLPVDTVPFGCFRRALWTNLGGLDEDLRTNEDYDFNFRVRAAGLRVMLDPSIRCTYYARATLAGLSRQYFRYGWWKARMLVKQPGSIRWRQAIAAAVVPALLAGAAASVFRSEAIWPLLLVLYLGLLLGGAIHAALAAREPLAVPVIALAFLVVHVTWSAGFWASLLTGARR